MRILLVCAVLTLTAVSAYPHGGGLNAEGCHNNRRTGDYHCHSAPSIQRETPRPPSTPQPPSSPDTRRSRALGISGTSGSPTCFVGPRGGTYTITKSGRKNYSGC